MGRFETSNIDSNFVPKNRNGKCIAPVMICPYGDHVHTVGGLDDLRQEEERKQFSSLQRYLKLLCCGV